MRIGVFVFCLLLLSPAHAKEAPHAVAGATTVDALQARKLYEYGALFVDVRSVREWQWGHVKGAVHLSLDEHFSSLAQPHWPRATPLVLYCDNDFCPESAQAARMAVGWGYQQVFYFRSGYFAWQLLDFPLDKGGQSGLLAFIREAR